MAFGSEVRRGLRGVPAALAVLLTVVGMVVVPGGALELPPLLGPDRPPEPAPEPAPRARVVIDPPAWDFGDVEAGGRSAARTFTLRNEGTGEFDGSVNIYSPFSAIRNTCSGRLMPGSACEIDVVLNLEQWTATRTEEISGTLEVTRGAQDAETSAAPLTGRGVAFGYYLSSAQGRVFAFGSATSYGDARGIRLEAPVVGLSATPTAKGYWLVGADGGIFSYGDAGFHGSVGDVRLNSPIVGMAPTPSGNGYWMVAEDGGIFSFGDAPFHGSKGGSDYPEPFVAITPTPRGGGYWLVAADGEVFPFGDAGSFGSTGKTPLEAPILSMAATPTGQGYWLVSADGAVFSFGDAEFHGALDPNDDQSVVVGIARPGGGGGYWLTDFDGQVFAFGKARHHGSVGTAEFGYGEERDDAILDIEAAPVPPRSR